ncbi:MAG: hypothetical protein DRP09_16380 [Candidatus Thorarchaeota archaeon]|nr:MAG: hypothetical protein DRP09_16380 [Candidatus Thorarchaeota archaeon]
MSTSTDIDNQTEESTVQNYNDIIIAQVDGKLNYTNPSDSFQEWETVTGGTSGATGIVLYDDTDNDYLILGQVEGTFQDGETITGGTSGTTATVNGTLDVSVTTLNQDLNNGNGPQPYDIHINCATRPLSEVYEYMKYITRKDSSWYIIQNDGSQNYTTYGEVYKFAQTTYTPVKPAPFGQYLGGTLFGARGIWIENMDSSDAKNFQLRDSNDTIQTPPNVVAVTVTSVVSGDRVAVFRLTQAGGEIDRQRYQLAYIHGDSVQFYNADTTNYTDETTDAAESTADDVYLPPQQSTTEGDAIYFGSNYKFSEVRINVTTPGNYSDITIVWEYWNGSAWTSLSVTDNTNGFTVSGTNEVTFTPPGDWAKTTVNGVLAYYIRARATFGASPSITTAPLAGECWNWHNYNGSNVVAIGTSISGDEPQSGTVRIVKTDGTDDIYSYDSWSGQRFVLSGTLSTDYSENQYVYVPIIDAEATSSSVTNTLIYSSDIPVLVRVRKYGIQPFQVESTITDVGLTVSAIRTTDNIVL